jgi:hypothetical protein
MSFPPQGLVRDARNTPPTCSKWHMDTSAILPHGLVTRRAAHILFVTAELRGLAPPLSRSAGRPRPTSPHAPSRGRFTHPAIKLDSHLSLRRGFRSIAFRLTG